MKNTHDFPVELTNIRTRYKGTAVAIPGRQAVLRTDTLVPLGIVSTKYELLRHGEVVQAFRTALKGKDYQEQIKLERGGAYLYVTYSMPGHTLEVASGDRISLQFHVKNSYDGNNSLQIMLGAFRLVCSNGMMIGTKLLTFTQKHVGAEKGIDPEKIAQIVDRLAKQFSEALPMIQAMVATPVTIDPDELFDPKKIKMPKYLLQAAAEEYRNARMQSLWGLYNALTWAVTHHMKRDNAQTRITLGKVAWETATRDLKA